MTSPPPAIGFDVRILGLANETCETCPDYNRVEPIPPGAELCQWIKRTPILDFGCSGVANVEWEVMLTAGGVYGYFRLIDFPGNDLEVHTFHAPYAGPIECNNLVNYDLPYVGTWWADPANKYCDATTATFDITSVS